MRSDTSGESKGPEESVWVGRAEANGSLWKAEADLVHFSNLGYYCCSVPLWSLW